MASVVRDLGNPIVNDNGSGMLEIFSNIVHTFINRFLLTALMRAGFAGDRALTVVFPTIIERYHPLSTPRDRTDMKTFFVGENALANKTVLRLRYPLESGLFD